MKEMKAKQTKQTNEKEKKLTFTRTCYETYILYMCQAIFDYPDCLLTLSITSTRYTAQSDCTR